MTVLRFRDLPDGEVQNLLGRYGLEVEEVDSGTAIPGSYWGEEEAGLKGYRLYVRGDTPVHSILHEACHYICMTEDRRRTVDTDAGGDYLEENAVCYLQILLAAFVENMGCDRMMADMDAWGYSFRLGSAEAWFRHDADDAREWLLNHRLIDECSRPEWDLRGQPAVHPIASGQEVSRER